MQGIMLEIITHNERETELFGRQLAGQLKAPVVLCLYGELGSGKTALVRGLAEGMGLKCTVSSPTFTIVNEYPGNPDLIHFDMYRLHGADELFDIGWEDYLRRDAILAVEWSENVEDAFDGSEIVIRFEKLSGTDRRITAEGGPCADTCV
jgi:tRNA threonylcarbamoyladenosine biosynthesis protein TsaE